MAETTNQQTPPVELSSVEQQPEVSQSKPAPKPSKPSVKLIAILVVAVILVGGSITALVNRQNRETPQAPQEVTQPVTLTLTSPAEGDVAVDDEIVVRGKTLPNTTVVIYTQSDETSVESDENGNFEETILLVEGENTLTVTAFSEDGQEKSVSLNITRGEGT